MNKRNISFKVPGGGRTIALVILVLATSISFALGFFVGKSSAPERTVTKEVRVSVPAPCPEPSVTAPVKAPEIVVQKPSRKVIVDDPLMVRTISKPAPPKRFKKKSVAPAPAPALATKVKPVAKPEPKQEAKTEQKSSSSTTRYSVQVGAFDSLLDAEKVRKKFQAKGYDSFVLRTGETGARAVFKVRLGEFIQSEAARLLALKLKSIEGIPAFVVRSD